MRLDWQEERRAFSRTFPIRNGGYQGGWAGEIYPFVKANGVYTCPDDSLSPGNNPLFPVEESYYYNRDIENGTTGTALAQFNAPASTVVLFEGAGQNMNPATPGENNSASTWAGDSAGSPDGGWFNQRYMSTGPLGNPAHVFNSTKDPSNPTGRHTSASNFLLADGHGSGCGGMWFLRDTTLPSRVATRRRAGLVTLTLPAPTRWATRRALSPHSALFNENRVGLTNFRPDLLSGRKFF